MTGAAFKVVLLRHWGCQRMREPDFSALGKSFLKCGIAPRYANRTASELKNHYDDIVDAGSAAGQVSENRREHDANARLGSFAIILSRTWTLAESSRPGFSDIRRLAAVVYPLACLAVLPAVPVLAGVAHREAVGALGNQFGRCRLCHGWYLLTMQLSILLG